MNNTFINAASLLWLLIGIAIGVGTSIAFGAYWRRHNKSAMLIALSVGAVAIVAVAMYALIGRPDAVTNESVANGLVANQASGTIAMPSADNPNPHPGLQSSDASSEGQQSMDVVTSRLAQRLAQNGGSDADWNLLAQSYAFLGRQKEADLARQHKIAPGAATLATAATMPIPQVATSPAITAALKQAQTLRKERKQDAAIAAYKKVIALKGMTADSWADYADLLASTRKGPTSLAGAPAQAIDNALALDPDHPKALWLKASLAHEEHRYADAVPIWEQLRRVIGDNDPDARIIDANLAEARKLAGVAAPTTKGANAANAQVAIDGSIDIAPALAARAPAGATLFVFAKAVNMPGPPLAVWRTTVGKWPLHFHLDDSMAMMPSRNLSSATTVTVEARISRSGQAIAGNGDLQSAPISVDPRAGKAVRLHIDKEVGKS